MQRVALSTPNWEATGYLARSFAERLLGVRRVPAGSPVVLPASSVHSFGLRRTLEVIGLDAAMRVVARRTLPPNRVILVPSARMIVELPVGRPLPEMGDRVEMTHV
jgi:uncharacterized protein